MTFDPQAVSMQDAEGVVALLDAAAAAMLAEPRRRGASVHLPREGRLLLTGDLHDNPVHLKVVRQLARLDRSPANHLVLHELIHGDRLVNGVDLSYRMLCRASQLLLAHPGQVHVVLANHELAQAFRQPVSKGAGDNNELFDGGLDWAFGDDAALVEEAVGRFVRAMPLAVRCANGLMLSHSLPSPYELDGFDRGILDRPLAEADYAHSSGSAWRMVWGRGWTRELLADLAASWGGEDLRARPRLRRARRRGALPEPAPPQHRPRARPRRGGGPRRGRGRRRRHGDGVDPALGLR